MSAIEMDTGMDAQSLAALRGRLVVVIMAGGAGTRFWPASTEAKPKQFLRLFGEHSLLRMSYERARSLVPDSQIYVLTNARFASLVAAQLPELDPSHIVGEPLRRDTAAAVALAAGVVQKNHDDALMCILTADHLIEPVARFQRAVYSAARQADRTGALYTFGIVPTHPSTAFGYLERGEALESDDGIAHNRLERFVEKPDLPTAQGYVDSGKFLWNSGMFVWRTDAIVAEFERQLPAHLTELAPALALHGEDGFAAALEAAFAKLVSTSVDYAIMEGAKDVRTLAAPFTWDDVGGWTALTERLPSDAAGNRHRARLVAVDAKDNLVFADEDDEMIGIYGVEGLVIVRAGKRTLVVPRDKADQLKNLIRALEPDMR